MPNFSPMQPNETQATTFTLTAKPLTAKPILKDTTPEAIYEQWRANPTSELGARLLDSLKPHIEHSTRKWVGDANPVAMGRARSLVIDALPRYEPGRAQLSTFIDRQLQPLTRWSARKNVGIKIQTGIVQEQRYVREIEKDFEDEVGRSPSLEELADRSGVDISRLRKLRSVHMPVLAESSKEGEDGAAIYAEDQAVDGPEDLWHKTVYHSLNPIDQVVFQHTAGLYGAEILSNAAIAKKLRISPGAVSQRKARIQRLLDLQDQTF